MKKKTKKILMIVMAVAFGAIMVGSSTVALFGGFGNLENTAHTTDTTITGTPADNYKDKDRPTFCETSDAKSNKYVTEFKIPTVCTQPLAITTDPSGNVWFTESNTGKLVKFDPFSRFFTEYENSKWPKGDKSMMWGIGYASDGNIWFTDDAHDVVWKFSVAQQNYTTFKYPISEVGEALPQRLLIEGKKILVNDFTGNKITFFDSEQTGQEIRYSKLQFPTNDTATASMALDPDGKVWYTVWKYQQGGHLVRYDPKNSNGTGFKLPLGILAPNGISVGPDGKIWITDAASSLFFSFDPESQKYAKFITTVPRELTYGNSSGLIKTPISRPYWNHFDQKGRLWFNEQTANSIAVFDPIKESLVEYLVPSQNPNWSDCSGLSACGIAQVLDFTINEDKIWFTEWVENNIGLLDSSIALPIDVSVEPSEATLERGSDATLSFTITPKEKLDESVSLTAATTAGPHDLDISGGNQKVTVVDQPQTLSVKVSADKFALSGTYKVVIGARYHEVTVSKFVTITIK